MTLFHILNNICEHGALYFSDGNEFGIQAEHESLSSMHKLWPLVLKQVINMGHMSHFQQLFPIVSYQCQLKPTWAGCKITTCSILTHQTWTP